VNEKGPDHAQSGPVCLHTTDQHHRSAAGEPYQEIPAKGSASRPALIVTRRVAVNLAKLPHLVHETYRLCARRRPASGHCAMFVKEWHEGFEAWPSQKNPYPIGSEEANAWDEGWTTHDYEMFARPYLYMK
jgi:hypothetical protein